MTQEKTDLNNYRIEHDLLGEAPVPEAAYYGIQTQRAMENFDISGVTLNHFPNVPRALAMVKKACAMANRDLGMLDAAKADAIIDACDEIIAGKLHDQFAVDVIQGGAGTSTNMNANEVIANRALELMGYRRGQYEHLHPNTHVNMAQSTNDVYPTAMRLAMVLKHKELVVAAKSLKNACDVKSAEFKDILKMGRTQLQDAVPMTLGQEFRAFSTTIGEDIDRIKDMAKLLCEINLGGTAIGTGITADNRYAPLAVQYLSEISGQQMILAGDLVEATSDMGAFVIFSSSLKRMAVKLSKMSNDLRLLSSGPLCGFNEINLPEMQPGSSIMPGKVNPVIPEAMSQIAFHVIGNDMVVTMASEAAQLQLNFAEPVLVYKILESIQQLTNGMFMLTDRCVKGITANAGVCQAYVDNSVGLITALNPYIGYENSSRIAKIALKTGQRVVDLVKEEGLLSDDQLTEILKPENMVAPLDLSSKIH
ncbi:aspartate ammonia-lyase [Endozoicomonas sp. OPT23]|uniref:aspartate ammonia-lyase n=1 Tax=Endozoicomonas sp. OPT23 TaxID=2072845 RepID=UPI00129A4E26|nr:aspartate ammonia-lyase [Endozoicomonas sp. OPT23]MRI33791.1 aspartate ammonia-lyase [Endozoicomonas sp. OPT23]